MNEEFLRPYLFTFIIWFLWIYFSWRSFKKALCLNSFNIPNSKPAYNRLKRIHIVYHLILAAFAVMVVFYAAIPEWYSIFIPLERLDHPVINTIGANLLKVALAWLIVAQVQLDKKLFEYMQDQRSLLKMEKVYQSENNLVIGILFMFIAMFVTISNVIGIILCVIAILFNSKALRFSK